MIIECINQNFEPRAIEMDPENRAYGWVYYKHPDGQWVTLRKATEEEMKLAEVHARFQSRMRDSLAGDPNS